VRSTRAFLIGAGTAFLLDPRQGRRRRHVLRDRSLALVRRGSRLGIRKARFAGGHARGAVAVSRQLLGSPERATDDATLVQRIRSEAFRGAGVSTRDVDVRVEDGVAILRGSVTGREAADALVSRTAKVSGVRDVAAMLRVTSGDPSS
jgi:osmotically-inducible protein OsmY